MKKLLFIISFVSLGQIIGFAQSKGQFMEAAESALSDKNYYSALKYYEEVLEFDENDTKVLYKYAEAARMFNAYSLAQEKYAYLLDSLQNTDYPLLSFWLGDVHQRMGDYDDAEKYYRMYVSEYSGDDEFYTAKAQKEIAHIIWARDEVMNPDPTITIEQLDNGANTPYSEFGAVQEGDVLYFSSMKYEEPNPEERPAKLLSKILTSTNNDSPVEMEGAINDKEIIVAHTAFSLSKTRLYYTLCTYINASDITCDIYYRSIDADGSLGEEVKLPESINAPGSTSTQPAIGRDPISEMEMLYFVSDREGGKGKLDIWYSKIDPTLGFSEPVNITDINTSEDDITPFYHVPTNKLYFSSEGRKGMGGFDVYRTEKEVEGYADPYHLGYPINSSYHEVYYSLNEDASTAHFSSNKKGSLYLDTQQEACCFDLYKASIKPIELNLNALTFDSITGRALTGVSVKLIDKATGLVVDMVENFEGNDHSFSLLPDKNYLIVAERKNYNSDTLSLSTLMKKESEDIIKKMYLSTDMMLLDVFTFIKSSKFKLSGATVTLTDLSDETVLDIVEVNDLGNDFHFMLDRGKTYKLRGSKTGFTADIAYITTRVEDKPGLITQNLYLDDRGLVDFLPLTVYFDNDTPDGRSKSTGTNKSYSELYNDYLSQRETFKQNFTTNLSGNRRTSERNRLDQFFTNKVEVGFTRLNSFMHILYSELRAGKKINIAIRGYASPRANQKYNLALGQRRVNTIFNEIKRYKGGSIAPYIENGSLIITDISYGEELAPANVSDSIGNKRKSIYSVEASMERKADVISVSIK